MRPTALVEREHDLATLCGVLSREAGPALALVAGEAGAGKTRLIREALGDLDLDANLVVVEERPETSLARLAAVVGDLPDAPPVDAVAHAVVEFLSSRPDGVLVVEDLHTHDPAVIEGLALALSRLSPTRARLVTSYRIGSQPPGSAMSRAAARLARHPDAHEIRLALLSPDGVRTLVTQLGEDPGQARAQQLHERTGGNPLFVEEVVRSAGDSVPWTVAEAVTSRLQALLPAARHVAELLAASGRPLDLRVLGLVGDELPAAVTDLVHAALAVEDDGLATTRHALIGEAIVAAMGAATRRARHRELADACAADAEADPATVARHWWSAGERATAAHWAARAADDLHARRLHVPAVEMFRIALSSAAPGSPDGGLLERAAVSAALAGCNDDAREWAAGAELALSKSPEPWRAAALQLHPALRYVVSSPPEPAAIPEDAAPRLALEADAARRDGDFPRAVNLARRGIEAAIRDDQEFARVDAVAVLFAAGETDEARRSHEERAAFCEARDEPTAHSQVLFELGLMSMAVGDWRAALTFARRCATEARREPDSAFLPSAASFCGLLFAVTGHYDDARAAVAEISHESPLFRVFADGVELAIAVERREASADGLIERLGVVRQFPRTPIGAAYLSSSAWHAFLSGRALAARDLLAEADEAAGPGLTPTSIERTLTRALVADALGDAQALNAARHETADLARAATGPGAQAVANAVTAVVARRDGRTREAARLFAAAARDWMRAWRPARAALAWRDAASVGLAAGLADEAAAAAREALSIASDTGLAWIEADIGAVVGSGGRVSVAPALSTLTPRELEIALLVADGLTNRDIAQRLGVSEKTVRNQLSAAFAKVGVSNRTELTLVVMGRR